MQRSTTQVLYRYLPGRVFPHEDGFIAEVHHINGARVSNLNTTVLLNELTNELRRWMPEQIGLPNPRSNPNEFLILEPEEVSWDVSPLTFECLNPRCQRVYRWFRQDRVVADTDASAQIRCRHCNSKMRQLRYLTAHNCGIMQPLHTQRCPNCANTDDMYLEDLGSFRSSSWRCRQCGAALSTRFTPCRCGMYAPRGSQPYQLGFTARDQQLWYPQTLTIINISGQTYDNLQRHPHRGVAALASWLSDQRDLSVSLAELDRPDGSTRMSAQEWDEQEQRLRTAGVDESIIDDMRAQRGPATTGVAAVASDVPAEVVELAAQRPMVERAGLFDVKIVDDRKSYADICAAASGTALTDAEATSTKIRSLGIEDISVTQRFPIALASYGFTRVSREPGSSHLQSYAKANRYGGKTPIFAVPADTEALMVTFDARYILGFLAHEGLYSSTVPADGRDAKLMLAAIFAADPTTGGHGAASTARRLVHSASHALLRALDDGQSGFGESSLAEWIVPDALTTAIYVASYSDFTLGALDTVLRRRLTPWLRRTADDVNHCDNDPMCAQVSSHKPHAACDRCLHLSFGCRNWNEDLNRRVLRRFWLWSRQQAADNP
ncbi:MAG: hypothetical protein F4189_15275 [Acidimicrobiaceae bacterium]|nr:hypothetical protein [Acidimicrobiaceae bacterium]